MLVTNFWFKYAVYRIVCGAYQALDVGRIHPVRERALRALDETVDYIDKAMSDAIGYETQKEVTDYALRQATAPGHFLEFGVFTGGWSAGAWVRRPWPGVSSGIWSFPNGPCGTYRLAPCGQPSLGKGVSGTFSASASLWRADPGRSGCCWLSCGAQPVRKISSNVAGRWPSGVASPR